MVVIGSRLRLVQHEIFYIQPLSEHFAATHS